MPASERDWLSRLASTSVVTRERIAMEDGLGKLHLGHAEVADGGAERGVADRHADHQPEREQAVDQRLAPLGLGGEMVVDVQRLGIERQAGEQHVVHLGHCAPDRMLQDATDYEILQIQPTHPTAPSRFSVVYPLLAGASGVGKRLQGALAARSIYVDKRAAGSVAELLGQDALVEAVAAIEHQIARPMSVACATSTQVTERVSA